MLTVTSPREPVPVNTPPDPTMVVLGTKLPRDPFTAKLPLIVVVPAKALLLPVRFSRLLPEIVREEEDDPVILPAKAELEVSLIVRALEPRATVVPIEELIKGPIGVDDVIAEMSNVLLSFRVNVLVGGRVPLFARLSVAVSETAVPPV